MACLHALHVQAVMVVRFAVALIIVCEGVLASNQFLVGPADFRLRFGRGQLVAGIVGVGVAQLRGVGPVCVLDRAGHDSCADPPQGVVAVGEVDPVRLAPLVFGGYPKGSNVENRIFLL